MKRTLSVLMGMLLLVGVSTAALAKVNVTVNAGMDLAGDHKEEYSGDSKTSDTKTGFSLGMEVTTRQGQGEIGGGIELQMPRGIDNWGDSEFNFTSFYAVGKYYFQPKGPSGFLVGRIGFDSFDGNDDYTYDEQVSLDGGLYTAFGGGFCFGTGPVKSSLTMLYGINRGTAEYNRISEDVTYSKLSLIYGASF